MSQTSSKKELKFQKFITRVDGEAREIEIARDGDGYRVRRNGTDLAVTWTPVGGGRILLRVDGRPILTRMSRTGPDEYLLDARGRQILLRVEDEITARAREKQDHATAGQGGPQRIVAPMPGTVVQVLVTEGDTVTAGQAVLIIEAMKMQNEVNSPIDGTISNLTAEPGRTVDGEQPLCEVVP